MTSFRDTVLSSRPRTGRRQFVPPKPQTALVMGSESLAAELSPQRRLSHRPVAGPGGKDHMSREGGSIVANEEQLVSWLAVVRVLVAFWRPFAVLQPSHSARSSPLSPPPLLLPCSSFLAESRGSRSSHRFASIGEASFFAHHGPQRGRPRPHQIRRRRDGGLHLRREGGPDEASP